MKKKFLSVLLAAAMVASLAACGGDDTGSNAGNSNDTENEGNQGGSDEVTPGAIPEAFAHITFDEGAGEGYTVVERAENDPGSNTGATHGIVDSSATLGYADGPVGQAIYLDGTHALDLHLQPTNTDAWTISYWMNADRVATYAPTLQVGYNMGMADNSGNNVTWFNITQSEWGENDNGNRIFPIVWSRNEASDAQDGTDCWPWMYAFDNERHGIREWVMVTLVASGEVQNGPAGTTTVGAQYYLNGQLVYDSQDNYTNHTYWEEWTWDASLAPNIMKPDTELQSYFGINYWDTIYKGFVDDLYVFDSALDAGQVLALYQLGNPNVESVAPEGVGEIEEEVEPVAADHSSVVTTGTVVGATDCSTGWWSEFSDVAAVPSGESVTVNFINYTDTLANWHNFIVVLQNVPDVHSADANPDYKEYAVVRADNYGWGSGYEGIVTPECDWNWETFTTDMDGAKVELTITNNGDSADIVAVVTTATGTVYNQKYIGIAVDGDLYYCLGVENAFLDIQ